MDYEHFCCLPGLLNKYANVSCVCDGYYTVILIAFIFILALLYISCLLELLLEYVSVLLSFLALHDKCLVESTTFP